MKCNTSNNGVKAHREEDRSYLRRQMLYVLKAYIQHFCHKTPDQVTNKQKEPLKDIAAKLKLEGFKWTQTAMIGRGYEQRD